MKQNVRETSLKAYTEIKAEGVTGNQRLIVFRLLREFSKKGMGLTRFEISKALSMPINAVCGRVKELLESNHLKERQDIKGNYIKKLNQETNKLNNIVELA